MIEYIGFFVYLHVKIPLLLNAFSSSSKTIFCLLANIINSTRSGTTVVTSKTTEKLAIIPDAFKISVADASLYVSGRYRDAVLRKF
jgi:hypothetical protein